MELIRKYCRYVLLTVVLPSVQLHHISGQNNSYSFTTYNTKNGLPSAEIYSIHQDEKHFLWAGHALGISRYDDYRFENFFSADETPLLETFVIKQDNDHRLWTGTGTGLYYFDNTQFRKTSFDKNFFPVYDLNFDEAGRLLMATGYGSVVLTKEQIKKIIDGQKTNLQDAVLSEWAQLFPLRYAARKIEPLRNDELLIAGNNIIFHYTQNKLLYADKTGGPEWAGKYDIEQIAQTGFIAQDVEKAANEIGFSFNGVAKPGSSNGLYSLNYSQFVVPLVKAVQEQQQQLEENKSMILRLQILINELQQQIKNITSAEFSKKAQDK